ncbi:DUF721 domain-containing protein [Amaricoccus solimangrovi]|uniref:DUF721 domain-containing protein n=1 Tax=Amaricoccus solimangrovi TaxID=2589815 RepID=A0A501X0B9_9RHOB|nr:DUF721 domain-containing protein [Amaricoccus solimangrovi]TPE52056.1 DUF721 domain-containing protein [Amaricoccus solimangrovi]
MAGKTDKRNPPGRAGGGGPAERRGRGFTRAGGLIDAQMGRVTARRGYLEARLAALWPEIAGPEIARVTRPVKLTLARGPAGGALSLAVLGALAPQVQMMAPAIIERVNAALGPGTVRRITLTQSPRAFAGAAAPPPAPPAPPARVPVEAVPEEISSIGDDDLRRALETLARNVLSRKPDFS